jgi:NAD+ diphosphatase
VTDGEDFELLARPERLDGDIIWLVFHQGLVLLTEQMRLPMENIHRFCSSEPVVEHYLGKMRGAHCMALELPADANLPDGHCGYDIRQLLGILDDRQFMLASRAAQILAWYRNHRFCSRCGNETSPHISDRAMVCSVCEYRQYPRITPCVIMLVVRDGKALLGHSARFNSQMFSCLAGFMEAGETAEQAVHREVLEEAGIRIHKLRYHGSQSWPFPHSLMLGFSAEYLSGEISLEDDELTAADWFSADNLPMIPPRGSIARSLIDAWLAKQVQ